MVHQKSKSRLLKSLNSAIALLGTLALTFFFATSSHGAGQPSFQNFFFSVCGPAANKPGGKLAKRCKETNQGAGDLSNESEASLNPSQILSGNDAALRGARGNVRRTQKRGGELRKLKGGGASSDVLSSPFSLLVNARSNREDSKRQPSLGTERGYKSDASTLEVGLDYRINDDFVIGSIISHERSELDFLAELPGKSFQQARNSGGIDSDMTSLSLFGSYNLSHRWYIQGDAGFSRNSNDFSRNAVFQESNRAQPQVDSRTAGSADGQAQWLSLSSGYSFETERWTTTPYVSVLWSKSEIDSFDEQDISDTGLAMSFSKNIRETTTANLGVSINGTFNQNFGVLSPQFRIEYERELNNDPKQIRASYTSDTNNTQFNFRGRPADNDYVNIGISMIAILPNGWIPFIDYEWQNDNDSFDRARFTVGFRKEL